MVYFPDYLYFGQKKEVEKDKGNRDEQKARK
jgi:hypothetical protein